jgi:hypothetical protein
MLRPTLVRQAGRSAWKGASHFIPDIYNAYAERVCRPVLYRVSEPARGDGEQLSDLRSGALAHHPPELRRVRSYLV